MGEADFVCLLCASCCRSLLERRDGKTSGITLTEKEAQLFPAELVAPKIALGLDSPETIMLYQLNVMCCPHLDAANHCKIYGSRPLVCRSFPVISGAISNRCKVFSYRKPGLTYNEPFTMITQLQASVKLDQYTRNHILKHFKKGLKLYEYDPITKQWTIKAQFNDPP